MDRHRQFYCIGGLLVAWSVMAMLLSGCTTRSQANARAKAAYIAGQKAAFEQMAVMQRTSIAVVGPVEHPQVEWTNGLTLARAIVEAGYVGRGNPKTITLTRQGQTTHIDPRDLLRGHDVPLQPGDNVIIRP